MSLKKNFSTLGQKEIEHQNELIEGLKKQERKAQFEIYKLYYKAMYNTAYRIVNNTAEAEDVMQDAFLDAFRKIASFDGKATFGAWLKRIVINKSIDLCKNKRESIPLNEAEYEVPDFQDEDHLEVLPYRINQIRGQIEKLPDQYRIIISLFLLEGYDHEEIAQILDISYQNSRTRFSRARKRLLLELNITKNLQMVN
jgi:RNA polymerase sigma-70 factor, ECF subfamily